MRQKMHQTKSLMNPHFSLLVLSSTQIKRTKQKSQKQKSKPIALIKKKKEFTQKKSVMK
jgi:hypothetical protein